MADDDVVVTVAPDLFEGKTQENTDDKTEPQRAPNGQFVRQEPDDPAAALAEQFKNAQAETERERAAREAAERRATQAEHDAERQRRDAASARSEAVESRQETVASGLAAAQADAAAAEQEYIAAFEKGDAAAQAVAQRKIARAEAKSVRLDEARADLELRANTRPQEEPREQRRTEAPPDPVEAYIAGRTKPTADWLRAHTDWVTDPKKNKKLTAAHFDAEAEGLGVDTPEYFSHVESYIGLKSNGAGNGTRQTQQQRTTRRASVPVAPVQASGGGTNGGGAEVRLSPSEARSATDGTLVWNYDDPSALKKFKKGDPIGIQEMARRKLEMTKQGLYDKSAVES